MNSISATIITYNEETNIERCLNSLIGIADEIIVVDSGSTDATVQTCQRWGCRVSHRQFSGYGSQRQWATSLASHTYILAIDADECLSEELRQHIINLKHHGLEQHRVYRMQVAEYYWGNLVTHCPIDSKPKIRLFNRRYAQWNMSDLGEQVTFPESLRPVTLDGKLLHYRAADYDEFCRKEDLRSALQAQGIANSQNKIKPWTPRLKAWAKYYNMMVSRRAWADGPIGRLIARRVALSTYKAWSMARQKYLTNKHATS